MTPRRLSRWETALLEIGERTAALVARQLPGRPVLVVMNRRAGTARRHHQILRALREMHREDTGTPAPRAIAPEAIAPDTTAPETIAPATIQELQEHLHQWRDTIGPAAPVIISLGGDGTHNQVMHHGSTIIPNATFVRLPLGSGNDGVVAQTLPAALTELSGAVAEQRIPAVVATTATGAIYRAFNIVSLGIDAFVPILHQRLRRVMPGNTYRIIANPTILFFERIVKLQPMTVNGETAKVMLLAMGVSGNRTYGDHIRVLPGAENVCVVRSAGLRETFALKAKLLEGTHVHEPQVFTCNASEVTVEYRGRIPIQFDGEAFWLEPRDFPLHLEIDPAAVATLSPARVLPPAAAADTGATSLG